MTRAGFVLAAGLLAGLPAAAQDAARRHVETIVSARREFTVRMGGTVDGENTRGPIVYSAWRQGFEPMRSVRLENADDRDVVNPWVLVNGRGNWRTVKDITVEAMSAYGDPAIMTDAEKARAIWDFQRHHRFHATTGDFEVRDPVKMFNVYGYSLCGDNAPVLGELWRSAGLKTRRGFPIGHCVTEVWYQGGWHMLDADESVLFLDRDNRTVVSEERVARDHDLAKRAYEGDELPALYSYDRGHGGDYPGHSGHTMTFTLRPGEALEWRWDHSGKHHYAPEPTLYTLESAELRQWGKDAWARLANGKWIYRPDLRRPAGQRGAAENVRWSARATEPAASAARPGEPAILIWKIEPPYVIVGGSVTARVRTGGRGAAVFSFSEDGGNWTQVARADAAGELRQSLDAFFPNRGAAVYRYFLRAELRGGAGLDAIAIENDLQMAPLSLPALRLGENRITYFDETKGPRSVRLAFEWVERSSVEPPAAPAAPVYPADGASVEGTRFALEWSAVAGAADYRFQLSDEPAFRWALSPGFDAVVSGKPRFSIGSEGLLSPGRRYFWRVRAKAAGVWGPWSKPWSFTPQAPGPPLNVRLEQADPDAFTLRWDANPEGRRPAGFRVYASDEKGFSVSDEPYRVAAGNQKDRGLFPGEKTVVFPANLLGTTTAAEYKLRPRHAFYRVVAVDANGNRSGSSDYVVAPRPFIYSEPPKTVLTAGEPFRYEVKTIASIGDLTFRDFGPGQSYQQAYWDADAPRFSLEYEMPRCGNFEPAWLKIDPKTGVMTGTAAAGEYQVNVKVEIPGVGVYVQSFPLVVRKGL